MKTFSHVVVTGQSKFQDFLPWLNSLERELPPQRIVQWNCAGPCIIGWGRNITPHRALPDDMFVNNAVQNDRAPLGNWFRKRRTEI